MTVFAAALGLVLQTLSTEAAAHARAGLEAKQQGRVADAIVEFRKAAELAPDVAAAHVNLGAACLENRDYSSAIPALRKALELNSNLPGAHRMLGYALLAQGYAAEAIPHLEQTNTFDALGIAQLKTGKFADAVAALQKALAERPNDPELLYFLGRASGLLSKDAFDRLEGGYPDSARAHQALGENYAALKRAADAEREYAAAIASRPDAPGVHLALGQLYTATADWPKAERAFRAEAKLQPGDSEAAYDLGQTLLQEGKLKEARMELERANRLRPGMPETLYLLGKSNAALGDTAAAEKAWKDQLKEEDGTALAGQAHFGLAGLFRKAGRQAEAERETEAFRKLQNASK